MTSIHAPAFTQSHSNQHTCNEAAIIRNHDEHLLAHSNDSNGTLNYTTSQLSYGIYDSHGQGNDLHIRDASGHDLYIAEMTGGLRRKVADIALRRKNLEGAVEGTVDFSKDSPTQLRLINEESDSDQGVTQRRSVEMRSEGLFGDDETRYYIDIPLAGTTNPIGIVFTTLLSEETSGTAQYRIHDEMTGETVATYTPGGRAHPKMVGSLDFHETLSNDVQMMVLLGVLALLETERRMRVAKTGIRALFPAPAGVGVS